MSETFRKTRADGAYRHWTGKVPAVERPRNYQRRIGGPPLLFATDIRMTLLVTLALGGTLRPKTLWETIGKKAHVVLDGLIAVGLVVRWKNSRSIAYVALNPAHPACEPLRALLLAVAQQYVFARPLVGPRDIAGGSPPPAQGGCTLSCTFGDVSHTLSLLVVYILGKASARDVVRGTTVVMRRSAMARLWMFKSHGILSSKLQRDARTVRCSENVFRFDDKEPLTPYVIAVLDVLDAYMPFIRLTTQSQASQTVQRQRHKYRKRQNQSNQRW